MKTIQMYGLLCLIMLGGCVSQTAGVSNSTAGTVYQYGRFTVEATATGQQILGGQFTPPPVMPVVSHARHAILVNYTTKELTYYQGGQARLGFAVVTPDVSYLPQSVVRGRVSAIERNPGWCPTENIRRAKPSLPPGCLPFDHPQNPMGMAKFHINWEVGGWDAVRLHGSAGYPQGSFWTAETFGCVNLLDPAMHQLLAHLGPQAVREGIELIVYR